MTGRRMRTAHTLLVLALIGALAGCASVKRYAFNRAEDLMDICTVELTAGPGADVHAQAMNIFGTAVGWSRQHGLMMHGRYVGMGRRTTRGTLLTAATCAEGERMTSLHGPEGYLPRGGVWIGFVPAGYWRGDKGGAFHAYSIEGMGALDLAAGASLGVGVHLGFSPLELLDFIAGWTTLDLGGDDAPVERPQAAPAG